jgi:hypothetical protein
MQNYTTNLVTRNALELTSSNVEIQNFPGEKPLTLAPEWRPRLTRQGGERLTQGRRGHGERRGRRRGEGGEEKEELCSP